MLTEIVAGYGSKQKVVIRNFKPSANRHNHTDCTLLLVVASFDPSFYSARQHCSIF